LKFTQKEADFIDKHEVCRFATSVNNKPHIVPVCYMFVNGHFYIATDYDTRKYQNLKKNRNVALVIDTYQPNRAVMVDGEAEIIEEGDEFKMIYEKFYRKFAWVRATPWKEGEAPFIRVKASRKASWGL
jgi:nitroimidazol reductase NimA-like FMN-containing flavoprotein (pyridoxamine 5'-phosphate oxidase superfamily)